MDKISYNTAGYRVNPSVAPSVPTQPQPTNVGSKFGGGMNAAGAVAGAVGSQLDMSPSQQAVSQMGPWGAIIGTASAVGTSIGKSIGGDAGGAISGAFDPAAALTDPNLSTGKKLIGAAVPMLGGIWSARAKKAAEAKAKKEADNKLVASDAAQKTAVMQASNPNIQPQVMGKGGWIQKAINPAHKGYCTPMTKSTCTGHRRALALRFKKGGDLHSKAYGGELDTPTLKEYGGLTHEQSPTGGTPVDANGNITTKPNASALVEGKEVAWNRGNNDTYIFSNRLGFASPAKTIMNQYKSRLGKDLNGNDPISRNTMNRKLGALEAQQEAVKSVIGQNNPKVMADGGEVETPDNPPKTNETPAYKFKDPANESYFNNFKQEWEGDVSGKDRARLNAYKAKLDPMLRSKDTQNFDKLISASPKDYKQKLSAADTAYASGKYSAYLSPDEIKKTLGEDYNDYVNLMSNYNAESYGIKGKKEAGSMPDLNYGLRTSESIQPYKYVKSVLPQSSKQPTARFEGGVQYDPTTKQYKYEYSKPIEYDVKKKGEFDTMACGGKIRMKKMANGGNLDNSLDVDMSGLPKAKYNTFGMSKSQAYSPNMRPNQTYLGDIVPIAGAAGASMLGNLYAINQLNKNKPKDVNLGRVNARTINLGDARQSLRQSAGEDLANLRSAAKNAGSTNYMNQMIAGTTGTQRELGKNLLQSYQTEATTNAQAQADADRTNIAAAAQEASINAQRKDTFNAQKAALTSNLFTIPQQAMADYLKGTSIRDAAQASGNYDIVTDPTNRFKLKFKARKQ